MKTKINNYYQPLPIIKATQTNHTNTVVFASDNKAALSTATNKRHANQPQ